MADAPPGAFSDAVPTSPIRNSTFELRSPSIPSFSTQVSPAARPWWTRELGSPERPTAPGLRLGPVSGAAISYQVTHGEFSSTYAPGMFGMLGDAVTGLSDVSPARAPCGGTGVSSPSRIIAEVDPTTMIRQLRRSSGCGVGALGLGGAAGAHGRTEGTSVFERLRLDPFGGALAGAFAPHNPNASSLPVSPVRGGALVDHLQGTPIGGLTFAHPATATAAVAMQPGSGGNAPEYNWFDDATALSEMGSSAAARSRESSRAPAPAPSAAATAASLVGRVLSLDPGHAVADTAAAAASYSAFTTAAGDSASTSGSSSNVGGGGGLLSLSNPSATSDYAYAASTTTFISATSAWPPPTATAPSAATSGGLAAMPTSSAWPPCVTVSSGGLVQMRGGPAGDVGDSSIAQTASGAVLTQTRRKVNRRGGAGSDGEPNHHHPSTTTAAAVASAAAAASASRCTCPKSGCSNGYCVCFMAGRRCGGGCSCANCRNATATAAAVSAANAHSEGGGAVAAIGASFDGRNGSSTSSSSSSSVSGYGDDGESGAGAPVVFSSDDRGHFQQQLAAHRSGTSSGINSGLVSRTSPVPHPLSYLPTHAAPTFSSAPLSLRDEEAEGRGGDEQARPQPHPFSRSRYGVAPAFDDENGFSMDTGEMQQQQHAQLHVETSPIRSSSGTSTHAPSDLQQDRHQQQQQNAASVAVTADSAVFKHRGRRAAHTGDGGRAPAGVTTSSFSSASSTATGAAAAASPLSPSKRRPSRSPVADAEEGRGAAATRVKQQLFHRSHPDNEDGDDDTPRPSAAAACADGEARGSSFFQQQQQPQQHRRNSVSSTSASSQRHHSDDAAAAAVTITTTPSPDSTAAPVSSSPGGRTLLLHSPVKRSRNSPHAQQTSGSPSGTGGGGGSASSFSPHSTAPSGGTESVPRMGGGGGGRSVSPWGSSMNSTPQSPALSVLHTGGRGGGTASSSPALTSSLLSLHSHTAAVAAVHAQHTMAMLLHSSPPKPARVMSKADTELAATLNRSTQQQHPAPRVLQLLGTGGTPLKSAGSGGNATCSASLGSSPGSSLQSQQQLQPQLLPSSLALAAARLTGSDSGAPVRIPDPLCVSGAYSSSGGGGGNKARPAGVPVPSSPLKPPKQQAQQQPHQQLLSLVCPPPGSGGAATVVSSQSASTGGVAALVKLKPLIVPVGVPASYSSQQQQQPAMVVPTSPVPLAKAAPSADAAASAAAVDAASVAAAANAAASASGRGRRKSVAALRA